jgi:hypothetical protein
LYLLYMDVPLGTLASRFAARVRVSLSHLKLGFTV